jgi:phosphoglucosamine mutase
MMNQRQYFGTDGIRGQVGEGAITPEFMLKLGWAAGQVFVSQGKAKILIGKDTRVSGYMFESALEAGLSAAGVDVLLLGPMPTPAIAYLTRTFRAQAGIVISASHNPYEDNGIKFFDHAGKKLADSVEMEIEKWLDQPLKVAPSAQLGKAKRVADASGRYVEFCKSTVGRGLSLRGLTLVLDCAQGATYQVGPTVFEELGAQVIRLNTQPDGFNINLNCGSTHLQPLQQAVLTHKADLGIAFDGDGDRVMMVDASGRVVDGDELLYVIAASRRYQLPGVVGTVMTNMGIENAIRALGTEFVRAKVGDRYVMEMLEARQWQLGGESSGHLICLDLTTTGDALVSALQVLQALAFENKTLSDFRVEKFPQKMINVTIVAQQQVMQCDDLQAAVAAAEKRLAQSGRVLLRPSGTEPLIRVMVEGENADLVEQLTHELAAQVERSQIKINT